MKKIEDIKQIQNLLNESLIHLKEICDKHGLRFYLSNGTLLGAVKYGGFIPWDDDVDVLMPREDYNKLLQIDELNTDSYELLCMENVPAWKMCYAKFARKDTVVKETTADFGCEFGLAIDIFPIDSWASNGKTARFQAAWCGLLRRFMSASIEEDFFSPKTGITRAILLIIWLISRMLGTQFFRKLILRQVSRGAKNTVPSYVGSVSWAPYGVKELIPADNFKNDCQMQFNGKSYFVPYYYDNYLRELYGDYLLDPPPEKQKSNHAIIVWYKQ